MVAKIRMKDYKMKIEIKGGVFGKKFTRYDTQRLPPDPKTVFFKRSDSRKTIIKSSNKLIYLEKECSYVGKG